MNPIRARYAGTCVRTGQPYKAGDLIIKTTKGWALAQDRQGHIKTVPDMRLVRLPDGIETQVNVAAPLNCRACIEADGHNPAALPKGFDLTPYHMERRENLLTCPRCGRTIEIISEAELARRRAAEEAEREARYLVEVEVGLHLESPGYGLWRLSHRLPRAMWEKVADYFVYWSADDLDEFDHFDMPGGYYLRPGTAPEGVILNSPPGAEVSTAEAVEEILGIRPENRLAVLIPKWEQQAAERKQEKEEKEAFRLRFQQAFRRDDGLRADAEGNPFQRGAEKAVLPTGGEYLYKYPTGQSHYYYIEPGGQYVWDIYTNGADGDDWSADNCNHGIGFRFDLTPERRTLLDQYKILRKEEQK